MIELFECPLCEHPVAVDEDGCCVTCGTSALMVATVENGPDARRFKVVIDDIPFGDCQAVLACAKCGETLLEEDESLTAAELAKLTCRCSRKAEPD